MATRTVVCPECGAEVPGGRLSCIACGTLLASVAGGARRPFASDQGADMDAREADEGAERAAAVAAEARETAVGEPGGRPMPPVLSDWTGPTPAGTGDQGLRTPASPVGSVPRPRWARDPRDAAGGSPHPDDEVLSGEATGGEPAMGETDDEASPAPASNATSAWPRPAPTTPAATAATAATAGPPPAPGVPGAYVAPAIVPAAASTIGGRPATAAAIAAASITDGSISSVPATPRPDRWFSTPAVPADPAATPGKAGIFSDLPFRSPGDVAGWAVAVGAFFGTASFILPVAWSDNGVMGTQPHDTLTGMWGLANPANLIPMVAALAVLLLATVPNPIPASIRGVVLPILVGGAFLGIWWSYATGSYGLGWGVDALGVGGLVLVIGGAVAAWRTAATASDDSPTGRPSA